MKRRSALADILKGIAVVRMILVHLTEVFLVPEIAESQMMKLLLLLAGPPGAALFMMIMGYFAAQSSKGLVSSFYRGIKLIGWGLMLNIGLNFHLLVRIYSGQIDLNPLPYIFGVDILFLAGLSYIIIALFKKIAPYNLLVWVFLYIIFAGLGNVLVSNQGELGWWIYIQAYFYGSAGWSYFAVFPWAAYPVAGYIFYLLNSRYQISSFGRKGLLYLAVALFILVAIPFAYGFSVVIDYDSYYQHGLWFSLWLIGLTAFWSVLINLLVAGRESTRFFSWLQWVGQRVTNFYVIQWLLIGNIGTALYKSQPGWSLILWFALILFLSSVLTFLWNSNKIRAKLSS